MRKIILLLSTVIFSTSAFAADLHNKGGVVKLPPLEVRTVAGEQILLITPDGRFIAHGKLVATDKEAVKIMIKMLHEQDCSPKKSK